MEYEKEIKILILDDILAEFDEEMFIFIESLTEGVQIGDEVLQV